jgi:hypothetical protein
MRYAITVDHAVKADKGAYDSVAMLGIKHIVAQYRLACAVGE